MEEWHQMRLGGALKRQKKEKAKTLTGNPQTLDWDRPSHGRT
jgi:hypothetical protein